MKKLLLAVLLSFICLLVEAQQRIPREVHLGVIGGVNMSEYTFQPNIPQQSANSFTAGVAVRYIEETLFGLQAELLLTRRVMSDFYEELKDLHNVRYLNYLELPVMAHVYFKMGRRNEISFDAGPKFGYFLFDSHDSNYPEGFGSTGEYARYPELHHQLDVAKRLDYGIQAGLGYEFKFSPKISMMLQGRYYYGLGNMWPDTKADDFEVSNNQSIQIVLSLWWHHTILGKRVKR